MKTFLFYIPFPLTLSNLLHLYSPPPYLVNMWNHHHNQLSLFLFSFSTGVAQVFPPQLRCLSLSFNYILYSHQLVQSHLLLYYSPVLVEESLFCKLLSGLASARAMQSTLVLVLHETHPKWLLFGETSSQRNHVKTDNWTWCKSLHWQFLSSHSAHATRHQMNGC